VPRHRRGQLLRVFQQDARPGQDSLHRRRHSGDIPQAEALEPADPRGGAGLLQLAPLQQGSLRSLRGRQAQAQHPARSFPGEEGSHPHEGGYPSRSEEADPPQEPPGAGGRHRQPGQPQGAGGGGAPGEPEPHRPHPHGEGHPGADEPPGAGHPDAQRPDQRQAGLGGGEGVLRDIPALPVHGSDKCAFHAHSQEEAFCPWTWRSHRGEGWF